MTETNKNNLLILGSNGEIKEYETQTYKIIKENNIGIDYVVKNINTDDEELKSFLFSLGCYAGAIITDDLSDIGDAEREYIFFIHFHFF